jgi:hypothetical protein
MSPASFSHQTHTTSAFRCRTFLFARDRSMPSPWCRSTCQAASDALHNRAKHLREKRAQKRPERHHHPSSSRRRTDPAGDNAAALPLPPWRTRRPAGTQPRRPPPGTPPNESRRGGASSEREVVVRKRTRGDGKNQTKARSHLLQQRGQSLNPPCRRFACVASRRARALAASHVTARAPGGGRQVTVRVTGRVGPLRRRATREAHAQITLGARAPRAGRDREQPDASVLSAHSI